MEAVLATMWLSHVLVPRTDFGPWQTLALRVVNRAARLIMTYP